MYSASKILLLLISSALLSQNYGGGSRGVSACFCLFYIVNIMQWAVIATLFILAPELVGGVDPKVGYRLHGGSFGDYGRAAAFSGLFFLVIGLRSQGRKRWSAFTVYGLSWLFVLLSLTRGTMICAALMMSFAMAARYQARSRILLTCATLLLVLTIMLSGGLEKIVKFAARGESRADLESLTGRAQAFHFLMAEWKESPWLGFGYGAGNRYLLLHFQRQAGLGIGAAHDAVSRVLTDVGLIGAALLLIASAHLFVATYMMWLAVRRRTELRELAGQVAGLLAYVLVFSITSSGIAEVTAPVVIAALATNALRIRTSRVTTIRPFIHPSTAVGTRHLLIHIADVK